MSAQKNLNWFELFLCAAMRLKVDIFFLCVCTNYARTGEWKLRFSLQ